MVAVFTGHITGFERGSVTQVGAGGVSGSGAQGRGGDSVSVNAATGNLLVTRQDEFLVGRGLDIGVSRTYNSAGTYDENGDDWRQSTDIRVRKLSGTLNRAGSKVERISADGTSSIYDYDVGKGLYITTHGAGAHDTIKVTGSSASQTWTWTNGDTRVTETYNTVSGQHADSRFRYIATRADTDGNTLEYDYYSSGQLKEVKTEDERSIRYIWGGDDTIDRVEVYDEGGNRLSRRTRYSYTNGLLTKVTTDLSPEDGSITDGEVYVTNYGYDAEGRVDEIWQTDGSRVDLTYDTSGRVKTYAQTVDGSEVRTTTLKYYSGRTYIDDPAGLRTIMYYDGDDQLTRLLRYDDVARTSWQDVHFAYDPDGNVTSVTNSENEVTVYTHDENGNIETVKDGTGTLISERTYDENNSLTTEAFRSSSDTSVGNGLHYRHNVYDAENHLVYTISAEGHVTEYIYGADEGQYSNDGALRYIRNYTDHTYSVGETAPDKAEMDAWRNGLPRHTNTTTLFENRYDTHGNLMRTVDWGYTNSSRGASSAEGYTYEFYTYDASGRVLTKRDYTEATESYIYDGLGRLTSSVDLNGGRTNIVFDDVNTTTTVVTERNSTIVSTYDKTGALISTTSSGYSDYTATSEIVYDALGRVRKTVDPTGVEIYYLYDSQGRQTAEVNEYGDLSYTRYDDAGRVTAQAKFLYRVSSENLAVLADDPNNTLTAEDIQPSRKHGYDIWSFTSYDKAGRVTREVAGDGSVVAYEYDTAGRLISTKRYHDKLSSTRRSQLRSGEIEADAYLPTTDGRDVLERTFYDRDGRVIGTLDGTGYLTEILYDQAGRKIRETRFADITTASQRSKSYSALLATVSRDADKDIVMHSVYDGQSNLRFEIDGLGQVTEYVYKLAGGHNGTANGPVREVIAYASTVAIETSYNLKDMVSAVKASGFAVDARTQYNIYNTRRQLEFTIDATGQVTQFTYDKQGNVTTTTSYAVKELPDSIPTYTVMRNWAKIAANKVGSRISHNYYTASGLLRYSIDPEGYVSRVDYDRAGRVAANYIYENDVTPASNWTLATMHSKTNSGEFGDAVKTRNTYDLAGRISSQYDGENNRHLTSYRGNGQLAWQIEAYGASSEARTLFTNDGAGRTAAVYEYSTAYSGVASADRQRNKLAYSYNGLGQVYKTTQTVNTQDDYAADSRETVFTYDKAGRVETQTDPKDGVMHYEYDAFGNVTKQTDARGAVTEFEYDRLGRLERSVDAANIVTTTTYTDFNEVETVTRGDRKTTFKYDKLGRVTSEVIGPKTGGTLSKTLYDYNSFGEVSRKREWIRSSSYRTTNYVYNERGLVTEETINAVSHGLKSETSWSIERNALEVVTTKYEYDERGNLEKKIEAANFEEGKRRTTEYKYDDDNRLVQTIGGEVIVIDGGATSSATKSIRPTETLTYDKRDNIITRVDATGARTSYFYDRLDRLTHQVSATGVVTVHKYDGHNDLRETRVYAKRVTLPAVGSLTPPTIVPDAANDRITTFKYDALGQMIESRVPSIRLANYNGSSFTLSTSDIVTTYEYDANGNVLRVVDPNGQSTYSYYDAAGRKTAQLDPSRFLTEWKYDAVGNVEEERQYAKATTGTLNTSTFGTATKTPPSSNAETALDQTADRVTVYTHDALGRKRTETRQGVLTGVGGVGLVKNSEVKFEYNGQGNITKKTEATGDVTNYSYDRAGRLYKTISTSFSNYLNPDDIDTPTTYYYYSGLQDTAYTKNSGKTGITSHRYAQNRYDDQGRLFQTNDIAGYTTTYRYDEAGRVVREEYTRATATKGTQTEAMLYEYDAEGRVIKQGIGVKSGSNWHWGDTSSTSITDTQINESVYNAFGDVVTRKVNGRVTESSVYDRAGRLLRTNSGDGVTRVFGYDKNGNQTIALSPNTSTLVSKTLDSAVAAMGGASKVLNNANNTAIVATLTRYDSRNNAVEVKEPGRELKAGDAKTTLLTTRGYNAFGNVTTETGTYVDANGERTSKIDYSYNTMGRKIRVESPGVAVYDASGNTKLDASGNQILERPVELLYYDVSGRQVGSRDANGNLTQQTYLAGTGYSGTQGLVTKVTYADQSTIETAYDIQGDARVLKDQLGRATEQTFDKAGRLTFVKHASGLEETHTYDSRGNRIKTEYNQASDVKISKSLTHTETDYDAMGRVIRREDVGGDVTTYAYEWMQTQSTSGLGTFGGWRTITKNAALKSATEVKDVFGRVVDGSDYGSRALDYTFDIAGRMATKTGAGTEDTTYTYFNTGNLAKTVETSFVSTSPSNITRTATATYGYNEAGQLTYDHLEASGRQLDAVGTSATRIWGLSTLQVSSRTYGTTVFRNASASYDALGRMVEWKENGATGAGSLIDVPSAHRTYFYDAAGNVRNAYSNYARLSATGAVSTNGTSDHWYVYDIMNRVVVNDGTKGANGIVLGSEGSLLEYDAMGRRMKVTRGGYYAANPIVGSGTFSIQSDKTVSEGGTIEFVVQRTGDTSQATTVRLETTAGTATKNDDYVHYAGTITFTEGQATQVVRISTNQDRDYEGSETLFLDIKSVSGSAQIETGRRQATISASDRGSGSFEIEKSVSIEEGQAASFKIIRTGDASKATTVYYRSENGSARSPSDYAGRTGSVYFAAGDREETVSFATVNDSLREDAETFSFRLTSASGASFQTADKIATIQASDQPAGSGVFSIPRGTIYSINEGDYKDVVIERSGDTSVRTTVSYVTNHGSAGQDDYQTLNGSVVFEAGSTSETVRVYTTEDRLVEGVENFSFIITGVSGGSIGSWTGYRTGGLLNRATLNIIDDDQPDGSGTFSVARNVTVTEGNEASFAITRSGTDTYETTVNYTTSNGSAKAGEDYEAVSGSVTFAAGDTRTRYIKVATINDSVRENAESFNFTLTGVTGGTIGTATRTATISVNDQPVTGSGVFSVGNAVEGFEGEEAYFVVSREGDLSARTTINFSTSSGSAIVNRDFGEVSRTLTFESGDETKVVAVTLFEDHLSEGTETFYGNISNVSGGSIDDARGTGRIMDNGGGPNEPFDRRFIEGEGGTVFAQAALPSSKLSQPEPLSSARRDDFESEPDFPTGPGGTGGTGGTGTTTGKQEIYLYKAGTDEISRVDLKTVRYNGDGDVTSTTNAGYSTFSYDGFGRKTAQTDRNSAGTRVFAETLTYNYKGQVTRQYNHTLRNDGDVITSTTQNYYRGEELYENGTLDTRAGHTASDSKYALGQVTLSVTSTTVDGDTSKSGTYHRYKWFNGARLDSSYHYTRGKKIVVAASYARRRDYAGARQHDDVNFTRFDLSESGRTLSAVIEDERDRIAVFDHDTQGQIIRRDERDERGSDNDPVSHFHRFQGKEMGVVSNDSKNGENGFSASYTDRRRKDEQYAFNNGSRTAQPSADFSQGLELYDSYTQSSAGGVGIGGYTANGGETLSQVAQNLWGDSSLWYKIASANGLSGDTSLIAGQSLRLPSGVQRNTFNSDTVAPYDAADATGDLSPTNAKPGKKNNCGVFGQILLVVIAVAVTALTSGAAVGLLGPIAGGALAGAAGSVASQAVGVATGIQDKFSFKGVALAAIGGGVGGAFKGIEALGAVGKAGASFGKATGLGAKFGAGLAQGAASSAISQGIGVATGLQDKFSFSGVAAAGIGSGIAAGLSDRFNAVSFDAKGGTSLSNIGKHLGINAASSLASAATRSAIDGTNFGDNIIASIPDVIGQVLGGVIGACFTAETPVHTPNGLKRIDEIKVGDWVYSRDEHFEDDRVTPKRVIELYRFEDRATLDVTVSFEDGAETTLRTTPEHPFAVVIPTGDYDDELDAGRILNAQTITATKTMAWRSAGELGLGDRTVDLKGRNGLVSSIEPVGHLSTVHNFAVEDHHTYFVGNSSAGVWVHNEYKDNAVRRALAKNMSEQSGVDFGDSREESAIISRELLLKGLSSRTSPYGFARDMSELMLLYSVSADNFEGFDFLNDDQTRMAEHILHKPIGDISSEYIGYRNSAQFIDTSSGLKGFVDNQLSDGSGQSISTIRRLLNVTDNLSTGESYASTGEVDLTARLFRSVQKHIGSSAAVELINHLAEDATADQVGELDRGFRKAVNYSAASEGAQLIGILEGGRWAFRPRPKGLAKPQPTPPGSWVDENIGVSKSAKSGQEYAEFALGTPPGKAYAVRGPSGALVRFDGFKPNLLQESKGNYAQFLNKKGNFYPWYKGRSALVSQAQRQISAAQGTPIEWVFKEQSTMIATQRLFARNNISGIQYRHLPMPGG